jgi:hypothetical protein
VSTATDNPSLDRANQIPAICQTATANIAKAAFEVGKRPILAHVRPLDGQHLRHF